MPYSPRLTEIRRLFQQTEYDIRGLYGSTSAEPIPMLMDVIVMAMNCLMRKDIVWSGGLKKRRAQCSSFLIVVQ